MVTKLVDVRYSPLKIELNVFPIIPNREYELRAIPLEPQNFLPAAWYRVGEVIRGDATAAATVLEQVIAQLEKGAYLEIVGLRRTVLKSRNQD